MTDGFEAKWSVNTEKFMQRLQTFGDKIAKETTNKALAQSAKVMRDVAKLKAPDSSAFISDILNMPDSKRGFFWYVTDDGEHLLKVKNAYQEIESGNLKKKIRYGRVRRPAPGTLEYRVYIHIEAAWYAKFVEFGTSKMAPKPFMRPSFEENAEKVALIFKMHIERAIDEGL